MRNNLAHGLVAFVVGLVFIVMGVPVLFPGPHMHEVGRFALSFLLPASFVPVLVVGYVWYRNR